MDMSELQQGSDAWLKARCGHATASNFAAILAKGEGKTRAAYLLQVAAECLTGMPTETFQNKHTDRGTLQEPYARMAYEERTGNIVEEVGFIAHKTLKAGASPDGLIGKDGGAEIKSVIPTVQLETWRRGEMPSGHKAQVQGCLWICERDWWDFVSYSPGMPDHLKLFVKRQHRDEEYIKTLEASITVFLREVDALIKSLGAKNDN